MFCVNIPAVNLCDVEINEGALVMLQAQGEWAEGYKLGVEFYDPITNLARARWMSPDEIERRLYENRQDDKPAILPPRS